MQSTITSVKQCIVEPTCAGAAILQRSCRSTREVVLYGTWRMVGGAIARPVKMPILQNLNEVNWHATDDR
jgi:hypothetical protein